jgi:hypothetical protein
MKAIVIEKIWTHIYATRNMYENKKTQINSLIHDDMTHEIKDVTHPSSSRRNR